MPSPMTIPDILDRVMATYRELSPEAQVVAEPLIRSLMLDALDTVIKNYLTTKIMWTSFHGGRGDDADRAELLAYLAYKEKNADATS